MRNNNRFYIGLVGVAVVVTFLIWTGFDKAMMYYLTPVELVAKVAEDDSFHDIGVKVSGRVVKGSYQNGDGPFEHYFSVRIWRARIPASAWNIATSSRIPSATRPKSWSKGASGVTASSRRRPC